jgi:hypothetical protein
MTDVKPDTPSSSSFKNADTPASVNGNSGLYPGTPLGTRCFRKDHSATPAVKDSLFSARSAQQIARRRSHDTRLEAVTLTPGKPFALINADGESRRAEIFDGEW